MSVYDWKSERETGTGRETTWVSMIERVREKDKER